MSRIGWQGESGFFDFEKAKKHCYPPSADTIVFICGPPPMMHAAICGPRDQKKVPAETVLGSLKYTDEMVFKF